MENRQNLFAITALIFLCLFSHLSYSQEREQASAVYTLAWKVSEIPVCWENPTDANALARGWIRTAIKETWEKESAVKFKGWEKCKSINPGIRILIRDDPGDNPASLLGTRLDSVENGMLLNTTFLNWNKSFQQDVKRFTEAVAVHEFGHALGFTHQHNIDTCRVCDEKPQGTKGDWFIGTCDLSSVMNYCNPDYANFGKLSAGDKLGVIALYGPPSNPTNEQITANNSINLKDVNLIYTSSPLEKPYRTSWIFGTKLTHKIQMYVSAPKDKFEQIDKVTYHLPVSFKNRVVPLRNKSDRFGYRLIVYDDVDVSVSVTLKDGTTLPPIRRKITLTEQMAENKAKNPPTSIWPTLR